MSTIRKAPPKIWKGPVYVTKDHYEIWASVPTKLDDIHKHGGRWHTSDGTKFVNSQEAAAYIYKLHTLTQQLSSKQSEPVQQTTHKEPSPPAKLPKAKPAPKPKAKAKDSESKSKQLPGVSMSDIEAAVLDMAEATRDLKALLISRRST